MIDTSNWINYYVTIDGVNFVSKVSPKSLLYPKIEMLPAGVFEQWHIQMVREEIGDNISTMPKEEIQSKLDYLNDGYKEVVLCLAEGESNE